MGAETEIAWCHHTFNPWRPRRPTHHARGLSPCRRRRPCRSKTTGYSLTSSSLKNAIGRVRSLGLVRGSKRDGYRIGALFLS